MPIWITSGRAGLEDQLGHSLRVVPGRRVAPARRLQVARARRAAGAARPADDLVELAPGDRHGDVDVVLALERAHPHLLVRGRVERRVEVVADELGGLLAAQPLRLGDGRAAGSAAGLACVRSSPLTSGRNRRPIAWRSRERGPSGSRQSPAGESAQTDAASPLGRHLQRDPAAERVAGEVRPLDPELGAELAHGPRRARPPSARTRRRGRASAPNPGRSSAITSRSAASRSITGRQIDDRAAEPVDQHERFARSLVLT